MKKLVTFKMYTVGFEYIANLWDRSQHTRNSVKHYQLKTSISRSDGRGRCILVSSRKMRSGIGIDIFPTNIFVQDHLNPNNQPPAHKTKRKFRIIMTYHFIQYPPI